MIISKLTYLIEVEVEHEDEEDRKAIISRTRQKIKRAIFDSPDLVKPTKIQIQEVK